MTEKLLCKAKLIPSFAVMDSFNLPICQSVCLPSIPSGTCAVTCPTGQPGPSLPPPRAGGTSQHL